ncbi:Frag1/DRAM/Sfk1 family-domain-containing protein [Protomyces lactucae-debilis]|uniref:Frag1/DRAM/Sfk1 family-domain-containing protein n=1 Tax=Protomyces lactucae-debilis TaxID=2754530 RepID=A0A1Y2FKJ0_PROLT|nr:Frag1/DRAM/Sfk1 family-domain-containing protein [Protomyces lactucae-debilis]ORY84480.1 Frag1/DRAM/Sfk1 family-domain-containing protein [Protomyces lactucae-debilis]
MSARLIVSVNGRWVGIAHASFAYAAFFGALLVGMALHYKKIVQNEHYGYPEEWFPSVSATIGDWYPERSVFQLMIAVTSGPRFALVGLWFLLTNRPGYLPKVTAAVGLFRTILCGGWVYITSTDDHDWHDIFMISYLVATIPWTVGCLLTAPPNEQARKYRKLAATLFFGTMVPLIYFFIQHKVHRIPGAYTIYAFLEWSLVLYDVAFDAVATLDFATFQLQVVDLQGDKGSAKAVALAEKDRKTKDMALLELQSLTTGDVIDFAARMYLGFTLWSIWTSLGLIIWHFPLWNMGITGWEATLLSTSIPFVLGISPLRKLIVRSNKLLHLVSMVGIAAFWITDPLYRLIAVASANAIQALNWSAAFHFNRDRPQALQRDAVALVMGITLSSLAKFSHYANNPIWPIMHAENGGNNKIGLVVGILAAIALARPMGTIPEGKPEYKSRRQSNWLLAALGLGGAFFALHSLLSDSSTLILWNWEGFPIRGPIVVPHGALTLCTMLAGLYFGIVAPRLAQSWVSFAVACVGNFLLYRFNAWLGYIGGLLFAFTLCGLTPHLIAGAAQSSPGRTFGTAYTVYNLMCLMHVWIVAYAFVPGGPLLRERTDLVLIVTLACLAAGVANTSIQPTEEKVSGSLRPAAPRKLKSLLRAAMALTAGCACVVAFLRFPSFDYKPYHPEDRILTAGIWTVHFGLDNDMWASEGRMRQVIQELELDVIGLLESDTQRIIMGNRDMTQQIAEEIGMYADFGPGPNKHTWGAALLSKFPIINSTHHLLPSPVGELAPAIHATLDVYGTLVDVIVSHNGQEEDPEDRRLQSTTLGKIMQDSPRPFIFLGYVVSVPGQYPQRHLTEFSGMHDIEPTDWDRWCEYILFRGLKRVGYARVHRSTITDTEIQTGKFVIPMPGEVGPVEPSYRRVSEHEVPQGYRYPALFRGEGVRGHRYDNNEVVKEPWYYD